MSSFRHSYALVIGIDGYSNGIPHLKTAVNDAAEISKVLEVEHGYTIIQLLNGKATLKQIQHVIEVDLRAQIQSDDRFLFYFAGHGIALNGDDGPEGYLVPQDASFGNVSTYLPMSQVDRALLQLPCRHLLGVLDCCFAGAFRWSSTRKLVPVELGTLHKERFDRFIQDPAWQVITSASYDQMASDGFDLKDDRGQEGGHSPFAAALIEALQGKADTYPPAELGKPAGDGVITATELYLYLRERLEVETEARFLRQTPGIYPLKKHDKGEYIFLTPGHPLNLPPAPPLVISSNPYRGLKSFDEVDKDLFFGRQALTQQLAQFVEDHALTIVLGASGSGKSSLVKAGLMPHLREIENWFILPPFRPGESPLKTLNQVLELLDSHVIAPHERRTFIQCLSQWFEKHPQAHLLLVVDQLEELITLCQDDQERYQFLELLDQANDLHLDQLHLVLTLRSDFEPQFRNTALEQNWLGARFIVPPMTREELRQAIEEPASARVMYFDPHELVDQLIDEVVNMPGALPLLSFALSELYLNYLKRQEAAKLRGETLDRAMTQVDYEELGGVTRSLTQRAEREYDALVQKDPAYEQTIRNVMLRMVSVGGELARRRVPLTELVYPEPENGRVQTVLKHFETARLLTPGRDSDGQSYQEPAHDALVRGWKRLLDWKQDHLGALILQRELASDANQWNASKRKKQDSGLLWIEDPRLPAALQLSCDKSYKNTWLNLFRWRLRYRVWQSQPRDYWFNQSESDFIWQSFDQRFKRFGQTTVTLVGVILALSSLTVYAFQRAKIAQLREQAARVLNLLSTDNAVSGLVLAIDVMDQSLSVSEVAITAQNSLLNAIQISGEVNHLEGAEGFAAFSPDGQRIVTGGANNTLLLWNARTGQPTGISLRGHTETIHSVAFSPDSQQIVSGSEDMTVRVWSAQTGQPIGVPLKGHTRTINSVAFSPDGRLIVSGSVDETVRIWDARTGQLFGKPIQVPGDWVWSVAFSPDGKRIATGSDNKVRIWDVQTGRLIGKPMRGHVNWINSVGFSPDGKRVISGSNDGTVRQWDAQTGQSIGQPLQGNRGMTVRSVAFSSDGKRIVSDGGGKVWQWDAQTGQLMGEPFRGAGSPVSFSPDGKRIVSGGTVKLWDAQTDRLLGQPLQGRHSAGITSVAFSPDSKRIVSASINDDIVHQWSTQTGQLIGQPMQGSGGGFETVSFSPDGTHIIGFNRMTVRQWNTQTSEPIGQPLQISQDFVTSVVFSPDGKRIAAGDYDDYMIRQWDTQTGLLLGQPLQGHTMQVNSIAFSPDSKHLVSTSINGIALLWDAKTGQQSGELRTERTELLGSTAFSPDGRRIVSSSGNNVKRWDAQTGQPIGQPLRGHEGFVRSVAFSPDGQCIVSGSADKTVRLWDAQTGQPIGEPLQGHEALVNSVAFSPDGTHIVSGSEDGELRLWDVSPEAWLTVACNRIQYHPLLNQPETLTTDPDFIKIAHRSKAVCQRRVWQYSRNSGQNLLSWFSAILDRINTVWGR